jgi:hypothetical protein
MVEEGPPRGRQLNPTSATRQQLRSYLFLKITDLSAQRWL